MAPWIQSCMTCGMDQAECAGFSLFAICEGTSLLVDVAPYMVCATCEFQVHELLSEKTRQAGDDFIGTHFDCPPEVSDVRPPAVPVML